MRKVFLWVLVICLLMPVLGLAQGAEAVLREYAELYEANMVENWPKTGFTLGFVKPEVTVKAEDLEKGFAGARFGMLFDTLTLNGTDMNFTLDFVNRVEGTFGKNKDLDLLSGAFLVVGIPDTDWKIVIARADRCSLESNWTYLFGNYENEEGVIRRAAARNKGRVSMKRGDMVLVEASRIFTEGETEAYLCNVTARLISANRSSHTVVHGAWVDQLTSGYSAQVGTIQSRFGGITVMNQSIQEHRSSELHSTKVDAKAKLLKGNLSGLFAE